MLDESFTYGMRLSASGANTRRKGFKLGELGGYFSTMHVADCGRVLLIRGSGVYFLLTCCSISGSLRGFFSSRKPINR